MGGFIAALIASVEDGLDCVIAGMPFVALFWAVMRRLPASARERLLDERLADLYRVLDLTSLPCRVAPKGRFIYAGVADRITPPGQAVALWRHWGRPRICWYGGAHLSGLSSRAARAFVDAALVERLAKR